MKKHRDWQKRLYVKDASYFLTVKTRDEYPYFREPIFCDLFLANVRLAKQLKQFYLYGWVIIPNHTHIQIRPYGKWNISDIKHFIKRNTSRDINYVMGYNIFDHPPLIEGADHDPHLRGKPGDGHDLHLRGKPEEIKLIQQHRKTVVNFKKQFDQKYFYHCSFPKFRWQKSFHDHYIRGYTDFTHHMNYIANNPQKHGLPDDWSYMFTNPEYGDLIDEYF